MPLPLHPVWVMQKEMWCLVPLHRVWALQVEMPWLLQADNSGSADLQARHEVQQCLVLKPSCRRAVLPVKAAYKTPGPPLAPGTCALWPLTSHPPAAIAVKLFVSLSNKAFLSGCPERRCMFLMRSHDQSLCCGIFFAGLNLSICVVCSGRSLKAGWLWDLVAQSGASITCDIKL